MSVSVISLFIEIVKYARLNTRTEDTFVIILNKNQKIKDRYVFDVNIDHKQTYDQKIGKFILSKNATLKSGTFNISGCFGGYTNDKLEVAGETVVIECPGINFSNNTITTVDPEIPGNLSYIDGCSNSIIVPPPRNGEPCVNYLYFPPRIMQTQHTHPSLRLGYILSGYGKAHTPGKTIDLKTGDIFLLHRHILHNFSTEDSHMSLMVFHPDSDAGPTDEFNPMKIRTYIQK